MFDVYNHLTSAEKRQHQLRLSEKHADEKMHLALIYLREKKDQKNIIFDKLTYPFPQDYDKGLDWLAEYIQTPCGWRGMELVQQSIDGDKDRKSRMYELIGNIFQTERDATFQNKEIPKNFYL